ncbi:MAG: A/G-specific adenine glycosylase [Gemmatimonadota bacterium]
MKYEPLSPSEAGALRRGLLDLYDRAARDLPWRRETDPYRIWVSEIMLQQTRVETVIRYYERWVERFPDLEALASAPEDEVMKAWEGLGYYRRARHLHGAAQVVRDRHDGEVPGDLMTLRSLPGVGEYTAGAVASIAFGVVAPAVDGNVKRVLARLFDIPRPTAAWLRRRAEELVDPARPGDWNQSLMEFGATVCTPRAPRCATCPVRTHCAAHAAGTVLERPAPSKRASVRQTEIAIVVLEHEGRVLLTRRPPDGLLGGLWAFPEEAPDELAGAYGLEPVGRLELPVVRHRFTHIDATYRPVVVRTSGPTPEAGPGARWVDASDGDALALPVAQQKIFAAWRATESGEAA